jgi:enoyl-CoA hydratase/carnithine racemase
LEDLIVERQDNGIVTLTLNRPKVKNAVAGHMWDELRGIFQEVSQSATDRVLVITGAGGDFCTGADLGGGGTGTAPHPLDAMHPVNSAALALHDLTKPTIAKVRGNAVGAGMNLALGCDLIVAGESARFSQVFARRGLSLDFGGSWLLPRLIGLHKAKELAFFGRILSAAEAEKMGLVNRVVAEAELDELVTEWATRLAEGPPLSLQMTKRLLHGGLSLSLYESLQWEATAQAVNFGSEDTREGIAAFIQKRQPVFRGR